MTLKTERWDVSKHLDTDEKIALFLEAVFEDGDSATIAAAIGEVARVKGMGQVARDSGLSRENLHRALRSDGNPEFDMVVRVMKAMGFDLRVTPHASPLPESIAAR